MNTRLNNDLKINGFDKNRYAIYDGDYNLVVIKDINENVRWDIFTDRDMSYTIIVSGVGNKLMGTLVGFEEDFLAKPDELFDKLKPLFDKLSRRGHNEIVIRLYSEDFDMSFLKQLRRYGKVNDVRFYVVVNPSVDIRYHYIADLCCHYDTNGKLVVTKNRLGPTDNTVVDYVKKNLNPLCHNYLIGGDIVKTNSETEEDGDLKMSNNSEVKTIGRVVKIDEVCSGDKTTKLYNMVTDYIKHNPTSLYRVFGVVFVSNEIDPITDRLYRDFADFCTQSKYEICHLPTCENILSIIGILELKKGSVIAIDNITNYMKESEVEDYVQALSTLGYHVFYTINNVVEDLPKEDRTIKEVSETTPLKFNIRSLDFNIVSPDELSISINYRGFNSRVVCDNEEELSRVSDEITSTIKKIEDSSKESVLVDVKNSKDELGRSVECELRQNLDGSFVILKERYFGSAKIKLPLEEGAMSPARAVAVWVSVE